MRDSKNKGSRTQKPVAEAPAIFYCESVGDYSAELNDIERSHNHE
jgi:hypothetical protein